MGAPCRSSALSTMLMARSTPAQKPRGVASRISCSWFSWMLNLITFAFWPAFGGQNTIQYDQSSSHCDGGVGQVEGGPVPAPGVKKQEVHHMPVRHAVPQVSQRTAQYQ